MAQDVYIESAVPAGGGELTIAAMDEYSRLEIGRKTYRFVRRVMQDPVLREKIQKRAAEIREQGGRNVLECSQPGG